MSEEHRHPDEPPPGTEGDRPGDTVSGWIRRARRAQELVSQVDLDKVARHDAAEREKLATISGALDALSRGEDPEPGTDPDAEEELELDPEQLRRSTLLASLENAGYGERLGRIFMPGAEDNLRPLDLVPHREGLPDFDLSLAPEFCRAGSALGIFVSGEAVFVGEVVEPVSRHRWRIVRSRPYDDETEMLATIRRFMTEALD